MQRMLHAATREKKNLARGLQHVGSALYLQQENLLPKHSKLIITIRWMISHYTLSGLPQH